MSELRVLIVDDEGELAFTLAERLSLRGFAAEGATSGEEALALIRRTAFDVVVMDVRMPGIGGLTAIRKISELRPALPVILVTGHGCRESAEEGLRLGAYRYLMKPVHIDDLADFIRQAAAEKGRTG